MNLFMNGLNNFVSFKHNDIVPLNNTTAIYKKNVFDSIILQCLLCVGLTPLSFKMYSLFESDLHVGANNKLNTPRGSIKTLYLKEFTLTV